ncbi:MAG TPA: hypothetical protein VKV02_09935, partial [Acidobacteriaceae bacterium]|nr:hypothetical protein [Acidobacteriaceae bacterium]
MIRAACTIVSPNYLPLARTLAGSYLAQHPDQQFFVLIVADLHDPAPFRIDSSFTPVMLGELGFADVRVLAMKYDILELNTNVKPTFLKHLRKAYGLDAVVYLDPDIYVYKPLDPVFAALDAGATAVLTPHMTAPVFDGKSPSEQDLLYNGTYNLGFVAIGGSRESERLLDWWEERCLGLGFSEGRTGLFVDQKWMNLAPGLFDGVVISRDPGLNMAYWNLHERVLADGPDGFLVRGGGFAEVPLRFFHFSGLSLSDATVLSRNTDRFTLASRPDLDRLFAGYRAAVKANGGQAAETLPYGFDQFTDGTSVTRLARRLFAAHQEHFAGPGGSMRADPFDAGGAFARFARAQGLIRGNVKPSASTWKEFNPSDRRVAAVHRLLRLALRVLGPHRYEL